MNRHLQEWLRRRGEAGGANNVKYSACLQVGEVANLHLLRTRQLHRLKAGSSVRAKQLRVGLIGNNGSGGPGESEASFITGRHIRRWPTSRECPYVREHGHARAVVEHAI